MGPSEDLVKISIRIPRRQIEVIDSLISMGLYVNRSELIRDALRMFLEERIPQFKKMAKESSDIILGMGPDIPSKDKGGEKV